jgi:hypothetical protein
MRKVIDSNFLQTDELHRFLDRSKNNHAVLTDYSAIEAYKDQNTTSFYKTMEIVGSYPKQIIVLKGTMNCCGTICDPASFPEALIDWDQTKAFENLLPQLRAAQNGDQPIQKAIQAHGIAAKQQVERIRADIKKMLQGLKDVSATFTPDQIKTILKDGLFGPSIAEKVIADSITMAGFMLSSHPMVKRIPTYEELLYTFIFRQALCAQVLILKWIQGGRQTAISDHKLLNDQIDINFAAFALFFDGLLTNDKKLNAIHDDAKLLLQILCGPPDQLSTSSQD